MIQRLRRLSVDQMAKVLGVLYFLLGLIVAVIFGLLGSMIPTSEASEGVTFFGRGFVIAMPFLYGILGVIFGALIAALYNLVAGWTGGMEFEFDSMSE